MAKAAAAASSKSNPAKSNPAFEAVKAHLKSNPKASYSDVVKAVGAKGHKIYPIVFGRAKALLGLVPSKPRSKRGPGRPPKSVAAAPPTTTTAAASPAKRGPGRPRKTASTAPSLANLQDFVRSYDDIRRQNAEMRAALELIQKTISRAL